MKKVIGVIVVIAVIGYLVNSYMDKAATREVRRVKADTREVRGVEADKREQAIKSAVSQMVSRTGAIDDWESVLADGKEFQLRTFLTIDLEKVWLQDRPILYIGKILDIASHDQSLYRVIVVPDFLVNSKYTFSMVFELSLLADKAVIDAFLADHPNLFDEFNNQNGVAVVAQIAAIRSETTVGEGELIDIVYVGDAYF